MLLLVSYYFFLLAGDGMRDLSYYGKLVKIIKFLNQALNFCSKFSRKSKAMLQYLTLVFDISKISLMNQPKVIKVEGLGLFGFFRLI
jgi:hypothetical protein